MITSEVQRTLVKSPPELWAELSDPDALARHLGELGEIRITRTEPERLVEWEAEGTTGTVAIKASGWGTKVTLSVSRELQSASPAQEPPGGGEGAGVSDEATGPGDHAGAPVASQDADTAPAGDADALSDNASAPSDEADTERRDATAERGEAAEAAPMVSGAGTDQLGDAVADEQRSTEEHRRDAAAAKTAISETDGVPRPAPVTEAARRAAGWPTGATHGPAIESDLRAAEEAQPGELPVPGAWVAGEAAAAAETEPDEKSSEPEPRRGFFARLFARRRRDLPPPAAVPRVSTDDGSATTTEMAALEALASSADVVPTPAPSASGDAAPTVSGDVAPAAEPPAPEMPPRGDVLAAGPEDRAAGYADAGEASPQPTDRGREESGAAEETAEPEAPASDDPAGALVLRGETEDRATDSGEAPSAAHADDPADTTPAGPRKDHADLAAELRAAEEIAAGEVEAVLTGVLDRLGAAHHRPFSRS